MTARQRPEDEIVISYLGLRKFIGWLGVGLPFVLIAGNAVLGRDGERGLQASISDYYYTAMGDVFVGLLCAIAVFLFSYRGYDWRDNLAGDIAGAAALAVAWFPTAPNAGAAGDHGLVGTIHFVAAGVYFGTLAYVCLFLFTRTGAGASMTHRKKIRNRIYKVCGTTMVASFVALAAYFLFFAESPLAAQRPVLWLEITMILAFGISWLVKGEFILKDE